MRVDKAWETLKINVAFVISNRPPTASSGYTGVMLVASDYSSSAALDVGGVPDADFGLGDGNPYRGRR
jgi:hypothetical protein